MTSVRILNQRRQSHVSSHRLGGKDVHDISWSTSANGHRFTQVPGQPIILATVFNYGDIEEVLADVAAELSRHTRATGILVAQIDQDAVLPRRFSAANLAGRHMSVRLAANPVEEVSKLVQSFIAHAQTAKSNLVAFAEQLTRGNSEARRTRGVRAPGSTKA